MRWCADCGLRTSLLYETQRALTFTRVDTRAGSQDSLIVKKLRRLNSHCASTSKAAVILAKSAPHTGFLACLYRPLQARINDSATAADSLGLCDLNQRGPSVSNGEEKFRIFVTAGSFVSPVHALLLPACRTLVARSE